MVLNTSINDGIVHLCTTSLTSCFLLSDEPNSDLGALTNISMYVDKLKCNTCAVQYVIWFDIEQLTWFLKSPWKAAIYRLHNAEESTKMIFQVCLKTRVMSSNIHLNSFVCFKHVTWSHWPWGDFLQRDFNESNVEHGAQSLICTKTFEKIIRCFDSLK